MLSVIVKAKERTDSRASMVRGAVSLIRTRGVNATSLSDVLAESGAPRGSIYHHFPQGKEQLAGEAVRWTSERVLAHQRACRATTAAGVLDCFIDMWRQVVLASCGAAGCVVAGVALDTVAADRALIDVVRATFRSWVDLLAEQLVAVGVPARRASRWSARNGRCRAQTFAATGAVIPDRHHASFGGTSRSPSANRSGT